MIYIFAIVGTFLISSASASPSIPNWDATSYQGSAACNTKVMGKKAGAAQFHLWKLSGLGGKGCQVTTTLTSNDTDFDSAVSIFDSDSHFLGNNKATLTPKEGSSHYIQLKVYNSYKFDLKCAKTCDSNKIRRLASDSESIDSAPVVSPIPGATVIGSASDSDSDSFEGATGATAVPGATVIGGASDSDSDSDDDSSIAVTALPGATGIGSDSGSDSDSNSGSGAAAAAAIGGSDSDDDASAIAVASPAPGATVVGSDSDSDSGDSSAIAVASPAPGATVIGSDSDSDSSDGSAAALAAIAASDDSGESGSGAIVASPAPGATVVGSASDDSADSDSSAVVVASPAPGGGVSDSSDSASGAAVVVVAPVVVVDSESAASVASADSGETQLLNQILSIISNKGKGKNNNKKNGNRGIKNKGKKNKGKKNKGAVPAKGKKNKGGSSDESGDAALLVENRLDGNNALKDIEGEADASGNYQIEVSLSKRALENLWAIFILFVAVNVSVWFCWKCKNGKKRARFEDDLPSKSNPLP